jgi:hypothetical protein
MSGTTWEPLSEEDLTSLIEAAEAGMDTTLKRFWHRIKVRPEKWQLPPLGDLGGGFWVVAVVGRECVWYNDIEDGFNISRLETFGHIRDYWCNQDDLLTCVRAYFAAFMDECGRGESTVAPAGEPTEGGGEAGQE